MNIDEFRAMKAEMEKEQQNPNPEVKPDAQTESTPVDQVPSAPTTEGQGETTPTTETTPPETKPEETVENTLPTEIEIDGQKVPIEELKNGYLRQSDYTRKTQEVKRKEQQAEEALKFIQQLQQNPQVAEQLSQQFNMPNLDPRQAQYTELENKYYDLLIEKQITDLTSKYGEFDVKKVLETARDNNINDLDTAYHIVKSREGGGRSQETQVDPEALKEQLRQELLQELQAQQASQVDTSTIIQSGGDVAPVRDTTPKLSAQEQKVARAMGMSPEEYTIWRNKK